MTKVTEFSTALDWTALTYLQAIPVPGAVTLGPDPGPGWDSLDRKGSFWCLVPCDRFEETERGLGCAHQAGRWLGAGTRGLRQEDMDGTEHTVRGGRGGRAWERLACFPVSGRLLERLGGHGRGRLAGSGWGSRRN